MEKKAYGGYLLLTGLALHELEEVTYSLAGTLDATASQLVDEVLAWQPYHLFMWLAPVAGGVLLMADGVIPWLSHVLSPLLNRPERG